VDSRFRGNDKKSRVIAHGSFGGTDTLTKPRKITATNMLLLGLGWFGVLFFWGFYSGSMPLFLDKFTDSKFKISLVLSLAGFSGSIIPPIVGYLSDRASTRFGRRRPYVFFGILGAALCVAVLPHLKVFVIVGIISAVMYVFIDAAQTPYMSLLPDITPPHQRSTASGVMNLCGGIGLIASFLISSRIWDDHPVASFYTVAAVMAGSVLIAIKFLPEPGALPGEPSSGLSGKPSIEPPEAFSPLRHLSGILQERNAMMFFVAQFLWWLGFWVAAPFLTLFLSEELDVAQGQSLLVPMTGSVVQTLLVLPLGILGDRVGRKGILLCAIVFWATSELLVGFSQNLTQAFVTVGLTGIPLAAIMGVGYAYMLDLIPEKRTAEFVGIGLISMAAPMIVGPIVGGLLIDMTGYPVIFPVAALCMIASLIVLYSVRSPAVAHDSPAWDTDEGQKEP
jgi:MFS family permease